MDTKDSVPWPTFWVEGSYLHQKVTKLRIDKLYASGVHDPQPSPLKNLYTDTESVCTRPPPQNPSKIRPKSVKKQHGKFLEPLTRWDKHEHNSRRFRRVFMIRSQLTVSEETMNYKETWIAFLMLGRLSCPFYEKSGKPFYSLVKHSTLSE